METIRKWVQILGALLVNSYWEFPFTGNIYQGPLKVLCSPGLNCYSCPAATVSCPIGALQHLAAGLKLALANGQHYFGFYILGSLGVLGGALGRMICGWVCPFGLFQELLHKISSPKFGVPRVLRFVKYGVLFLFVLVLPGLAINEFGLGTLWFCKYICPAGTLEAGLPMLGLQSSLRNTVGLLFYSKLAILLFFMVWAVFASRPFCQTTCPLGAFYGLFNRFRLVKLKLIVENCTQCKECHHVCPMGVKFNESPDDAECITCLACMDKACKFGAIVLEIGGFPLGGNSKKNIPVKSG